MKLAAAVIKKPANSVSMPYLGQASFIKLS